MNRSVLFLSHSAGRTGAPILLLRFLRWLKAHSTIPFQVVLREGGPLVCDFQALAPTLVRGEPSVFGSLWRHLSPRSRLARSVGRRFTSVPSRWKRDEISLIYSNTIINGDMLEELSYLGCPVVSHVHELEYWIQRAGMDNLAKVKKYTNHYIACAEAVRLNLTANHGISAEDISVVHEFVDPVAMPSGEARLAIRASLGIPVDSFVVGGAGEEEWRKGKDLFVQLAGLVRRAQPSRDIRFIWVGKFNSPEGRRCVAYDIAQSGLVDRVRFVGEVPNPLDYFAAIDVFALTSREDPFPLVCLEAASLGKPLLCFGGAGGMPELVDDAVGFVAPYLDLAAMCAKIIALSESAVLVQELGRHAAVKVRDLYVTAAAAPRILQILEKVYGRTLAE
jgi:glycosyltransferase involved in cell wall biosynthesis